MLIFIYIFIYVYIYIVCVCVCVRVSVDVCVCVCVREKFPLVCLSVCLYICLSVYLPERETDCVYSIMVQTYDVGLLSARHPRHPEEMGAQ